MKLGDTVRTFTGKVGPVIELLPYDRVAVLLMLYPYGACGEQLAVECPVIYLRSDVETLAADGSEVECQRCLEYGAASRRITSSAWSNRGGDTITPHTLTLCMDCYIVGAAREPLESMYDFLHEWSGC